MVCVLEKKKKKKKKRKEKQKKNGAVNYIVLIRLEFIIIVGGTGGTGARENMGRERKRREAGVQRWRDAGMKLKTLLVDI